MTKEQFQRAYTLAMNRGVDLSKVDIDIFDGFATREFSPITVSIEAVARVIRWQCFEFGGGIDQEKLDECARCFRHKVTMLEVIK